MNGSYSYNMLGEISDDDEVDYGTFKVCEYPGCITVLNYMREPEDTLCYVCIVKALKDEDKAFSDKIRRKYLKYRKGLKKGGGK